MSKIDLSKAKIGDKFRTRNGFIRTYYECGNYKIINYYLLKDEDGNKFYYHQYGNFIYGKDTECDLVEQVLDKPLDELIEEGTKLIKENDDAIAEENKLQRRHEVLKYADMVFFNKNWEQEYINAIETAEYIVNLRNQYLKDGKLC